MVFEVMVFNRDSPVCGLKVVVVETAGSGCDGVMVLNEASDWGLFVVIVMVL